MTSTPPNSAAEAVTPPVSAADTTSRDPGHFRDLRAEKRARHERWIHQQIEAAFHDGETLASLTDRLGMTARKLRRWLVDRDRRHVVRDDLAAALDDLR